MIFGKCIFIDTFKLHTSADNKKSVDLFFVLLLKIGFSRYFNFFLDKKINEWLMAASATRVPIE